MTVTRPPALRLAKWNMQVCIWKSLGCGQYDGQMTEIEVSPPLLVFPPYQPEHTVRLSHHRRLMESLLKIFCRSDRDFDI